MKLLPCICLLLLTAVAAAQLQPVPGEQRPGDRDAIRAHIESIFQGFIDHDGPKLRATHAPEWRGFLEGSRSAIQGIDQYMRAIDGATRPGPWGMKSYKITEFDVLFYGDVALVPFVAEVEGADGDGTRSKSKLRILDVYAKLDGHWIQAGSDTQTHPDAQREQMSNYVTLPDSVKKSLLDTREKVWRAWFSGDQSFLESVLPAEVLSIDPGPGDWSHREEILSSAKRFADSGAKLTRLEFPKTEVQTYGRVAQVYSTYLFETERGGEKHHSSGRATETFVYRDGKWINTGWHMDAAPLEQAGTAK